MTLGLVLWFLVFFFFACFVMINWEEIVTSVITDCQHAEVELRNFRNRPDSGETIT